MKQNKTNNESVSVPTAMSSGWLGSVLAVYRGYSAGMKVLFWAILTTHLPLLALLFNTLWLDFDVTTTAYQHMGMIARIVDGLPLYAKGSSEYSVVTYTPLYWGLVAMLSKVFGLSFTLARVVSVGSSLATWLGVAAFVWVNTNRNLILSVTAPTLLFATSVLIGNWVLDINVNALHFALVVWGFFCLREPLTHRRVGASAILLALAVLAKQTGLAYVAAAGFMVLVVSPRRFPLYIVLSGGVLVAAFVVLQGISHGQFWNQIGTANVQLLWMGRRIVDEIVLQSFCGYAGIMLVFSIFCLAVDWKKNVFLLARQPHYVMLGAGIIVACIAHPKYGSGNIHDVIALAGLYICGCIGLHRLLQMGGEICRRFVAIFPLTQLIVLLLIAHPRWATFFVTELDKARYAQISNIFQSGRACLFGVPYIQRVFNQPVSGIPDNECDKWRNGQLDYSVLPDLYLQPFREEVFDYVIIADYFDPSHPVCKTILEHYPVVVEKFPANPPFETFLRHEMYVLKAKHSVANPQSLPRIN